jgi:hypothetical protein
MKMVVFWDVPPSSLTETDLSFRRPYCLHHWDERMNLQTKGRGSEGDTGTTGNTNESKKHTLFGCPVNVAKL